MRIGIDLDDVAVDSITAIIGFHNEKSGACLTKGDRHSYNLWEVWGGTREEAIEKVNEFFATDTAWDLDPMPGSVKALTALKEKGHELFIITARDKDSVGKTEKWIEKNFPRLFAGVHFGNAYNLSGEPRKKSEMCKEVGVEMLVDDHLENAFDCAAAGIRVLLFDQPWNRQELTLPKNVERVFSWDEVVRKI